MHKQTPQSINRKTVRIALLAMLAVFAGLFLIILRSYPPTENSWYPGCMLYRMTGLHCTGCGITRSLHSALNGEFQQALAWNVLVVLLVPVVTYQIGSSLINWALDRPTPLSTNRLNRWSLKAFVLLIIVFSVSRNLPWYPLTLLAPHELNKNK